LSATETTNGNRVRLLSVRVTVPCCGGWLLITGAWLFRLLPFLGTGFEAVVPASV
jgi:hypothetical protein